MIERDGTQRERRPGKNAPSKESPADFATIETAFTDDKHPWLNLPKSEPTAASLSTSASDLAERIKSRSFAESAEALRRAHSHVAECRTEPYVDGKTTQVGDLALLPSKGTAFLFSDLEGNIADFVSALDEHRILERLRVNDPDDQVFLCVLGDSIDRSRTSSILMEFLLELKSTPEFSRNVIILPGNHELSMSVQSQSDRPGDPRKRLGLRDEILEVRDSYRSVDLSDENVAGVAAICHEERFKDYRPYDYSPTLETARAHEARVGMWLLFNDIFQLLPKMTLSSNGLCAFHAGFPATGYFGNALERASSLTDEEKHELLMELASITETGPERMTCHPMNRPLDDITWSDIDPSVDNTDGGSLVGKNQRGANGKPGPGMAWGQRALDRFFAISGSTLAVRGHQPTPPAHPDVKRTRNGAWMYKNCVTISSSGAGGTFVSIDLSVKTPTPENVRYYTPLMDF